MGFAISTPKKRKRLNIFLYSLIGLSVLMAAYSLSTKENESLKTALTNFFDESNAPANEYNQTAVDICSDQVEEELQALRLKYSNDATIEIGQIQPFYLGDDIEEWVKRYSQICGAACATTRHIDCDSPNTYHPICDDVRSLDYKEEGMLAIGAAVRISEPYNYFYPGELIPVVCDPTGMLKDASKNTLN